MTTANWEVFERDPRQLTIPNQGVTKVGPPRDDRDWSVLKWELTSFVCEGEYALGLERVLSAYLTNLTNPEQTAVWVSGFFGSGKSHLVRVLAALWQDLEFPDGSRARGLAQLPTDIEDLLAELSTAGKRAGGLWSATGKLGAGSPDSYRLAFLSVLFDNAGLPTQFPAARLAMKLRGEGVYETVLDQLRDAGKDPDDEFLNLYVSTVLAQAVVNALPDLAGDQREARDLFREQYPDVRDIDEDSMITVAEEVLHLQATEQGEIPHTVVVLDELQQYVGEDQRRLDHVGSVAEACATHFDRRVILVGTGQSALQGSPLLARIQDRFYDRVELSDRDVESVIRSVVLRKNSDHKAELTATLEGSSGEIDRHLEGTLIGPTPSDQTDLVPDYPLLPVRRRFWEHALRAVDRGGGTGQLRTQLRITHEAAQEVAENSIGHVVPADFLFFRQADGMLSTRVLSRDMLERITGYDDGTSQGQLKSRLLALIFLIAQLPRDPGVDVGLRATPEALADLLVEDLSAGSAALRKSVESILKELETQGAILKVDSEFRLQTPEGEELQRKFAERAGQIRNDSRRVVAERDRDLREAVEAAVGNIKLLHGESRTPRKLDISYGSEPPPGSAAIPVWVRDGWDVSATDFADQARESGVDDATVYVFLPRLHSDDLRDHIADVHAAREVLDTVPLPDTPEGHEARLGLESRLRTYEAQLESVVAEITSTARILQGGGTEVAEASLRASVEKAANASLARRFPRFSDGDHAKWGIVLSRAREGNADALNAVGFKGDADQHPVGKAILQFTSPNGTKGSDIRSHFKANEYGWPGDAIDGALFALVATGHVRARRKDGSDVGVKDLNQRDIATATFSPETVVLTATEKIELRKLLTDANESLDPTQHLPTEPGSELEGISRLLQIMLLEARDAGGDPPLPEPPDALVVEELLADSGNSLLKRTHDRRQELLDAHGSWATQATLKEDRLAAWGTVQRLLSHGSGLPSLDDARAKSDAIEKQRDALNDPNPIAPLAASVAETLREELGAARTALSDAIEEARLQAAGYEEWDTLDSGAAEDVLARYGLATPLEPIVGTEAELLASLDTTGLTDWADKRAAVSGRLAAAHADLVKLAAPKVNVVSAELPRATLKSEEDIDAYLEEVRKHLLDKLGPDTHIVV